MLSEREDRQGDVRYYHAGYFADYLPLALLNENAEPLQFYLSLSLFKCKCYRETVVMLFAGESEGGRCESARLRGWEAGRGGVTTWSAILCHPPVPGSFVINSHPGLTHSLK